MGLFPVSYTTPAPPAPFSFSSGDGTNSGVVHLEQKTIDTLPEQSEPGYLRPETGTNHIIAPVPKATYTHFLNDSHHDFDVTNEHDPLPVGDEVMKATLTDVQKAIEQLSRNRGDNDGDRSFSFASSRDDRGTDTDTDLDLSDLDCGTGDDNEEDVLGWQKGARMKLAEKARKAVEEAKKLEVMMGGRDKLTERRLVVPPIEVEVSDESEDEIEHEGFMTRTTIPAFSGIPEEEDENVLDVDGASASSRSKSLSPLKDEAQLEVVTATQTSFPATSLPSQSPIAAGLSHATENSEPHPNVKHLTSSIPTSTRNSRDAKPEGPASNAEHVHTITLSLQEFTNTSTSTFPSPAEVPPSLPPLPQEMSPSITATAQSKHASIASAKSHISSLHHDVLSIPASSPEPTFPSGSSPSVISIHHVDSTTTSTTATTTKTVDSTATGVTAVTAVAAAAKTVIPLVSPPLSATSPSSEPIPMLPTPPVADEKMKKEKAHPSGWVLEDVVEWLKNKGFDQDVCDKFVGMLSFPRVLIPGLHSSIPFSCDRTRNHGRRSSRTRR